MSGKFDPFYQWLGIPAGEQPPNHYRLLGVQLFESDPAVIQNASDQRMAHLKTFGTGPHSHLSQRLLNEVAVAVVCLLKPAKKQAYDQSLRSSVTPAKASQPVPQPRPVKAAAPAPKRAAATRTNVPNAPIVSATSAAASAAERFRRRGGKGHPVMKAVEIAIGGMVAVVLAYFVTCVVTPDADFLDLFDRQGIPSQKEVAKKLANQDPPKRVVRRRKVKLDRAVRVQPVKVRPTPLPRPTGLPVEPPVKPVSVRSLPPGGWARIVLPSEKVLSKTQLMLSADRLEGVLSEKMPLYSLRFSNGELSCILSHGEGKLNGLAGTVFENGSVQGIAFYRNGARHGRTHLWEENGNRLFMGEYQGGNKHGLVCLFKDGRPWLIQDCANGKVDAVYLVKFKAGVAELVPHGGRAGEPPEEGEFAEAIEKFDTLEAEMNAAEGTVKGQLRKWWSNQRTLFRRERGRQRGRTPAERKKKVEEFEREYKANVQKLLSEWRTALRRTTLR